MARAATRSAAPGNPPGLIALAFGTVASQALAAGLKLGVLEQLEKGPATARQLARRVGADERGVRTLLNPSLTLGPRLGRGVWP
jgi:hypothetical protein